MGKESLVSYTLSFYGDEYEELLEIFNNNEKWLERLDESKKYGILISDEWHNIMERVKQSQEGF